LEQYLVLGDVHAQASQLPKAIERFAEGVRYAVRSGSASPFAINLRHRLAETRVRQGDLKGALTAYQELHQQSPEDERAHFYIVDLEMRLGQGDAALRDLDELITRYQSRRELLKVQGVLEALAQSYPGDLGLAQRLVKHYLSVGANDQAVAVLDTLGEALLRAGQKQAAAETIRQIIAMNPPRVSDYRKLLQEMSE